MTGVDWVTVLVLVAVNGVVDAAGVSYLAGWWSKRRLTTWLTSPESNPYVSRVVDQVISRIAPTITEERVRLVTSTVVRDEVERLKVQFPTREELNLKFDDTRARTVAAIEGWWGARVAKFEEQAARTGESAEALAEYEELKGVVGAKGAKAAMIGERILKRHRERRAGGQQQPAAPAAQPSNGQRTLAVKPEVVEALKAAGFVMKDAGPTESATPGTSS